MTHPDVVFARFVAANPVPDGRAVPPSPSVDDILDLMQGLAQPRPPERGRGPSRRGWIVALASFLVVLSIGVGLNWLRGEAGTEVGVDPLEALRRDAVSTTERWLDAVNRGDIETAMALSSPVASTTADRRVSEWLAGFAERGMPTRIAACQVVEATADRASVECQVRLTDPVAVELGVSELVAPFVYQDGLVAWQPYRGGDIGRVNAAYSEYLRLFNQVDYERVCAPNAYPSDSIVQDQQLALTGECAELAAPLADDVSQWIREGRTIPDG